MISTYAGFTTLVLDQSLGKSKKHFKKQFVVIQLYRDRFLGAVIIRKTQKTECYYLSSYCFITIIIIIFRQDLDHYLD